MTEIYFHSKTEHGNESFELWGVRLGVKEEVIPLTVKYWVGSNTGSSIENHLLGMDTVEEMDGFLELCHRARELLASPQLIVDGWLAQRGAK